MSEVTPAQIAVLEELQDGEWRSSDYIQDATALAKDELDEALDALVASRKIAEVANREYRITSNGFVDIQPLPP